MKATRKNLLEYVKDQYGTRPEFLWEKYPKHGVLRHPSGKWYGIFMDIPGKNVGLKRERADILVAKCAPNEREELLMKNGWMTAYHMNKRCWVSALMGEADYEEACRALDRAFLSITAKKPAPPRPPKSIILPVNPKYHDVAADLEKSPEISWVQPGNIRPEDRLYLYITAPVSGIVYALDVISAQPREEENGSRRGRATLVTARLARTYSPPVPLSVLQEHGIMCMRSARTVPYGLQYELEGRI